MPAQHLLLIYLISLVLFLLPAYGLALLFQKAGVSRWKAFLPFYNTWVIQGLANRPRHWVIWQAVPVVGWFVTLGIYIEWVKLFGRFRFLDGVATTLFTPLYFLYLGYHPAVRYLGPKGAQLHKKSAVREWVDAAVFATVAATLIRTFVFEAYAIPTGSMEKTMLVNEYLFVNKMSYGPRIPNTPLSIPFVHNYIPGTGVKSYSTLLQLGYIRWFANEVKRGDVVVFNVPIGDTVINREDYQTARPYYDIKRAAEKGERSARYILEHREEYPLATHPFDKADNYVKRCTGVAGDTLQIKGGLVYINGQVQPLPPLAQMPYRVVTGGQMMDRDLMKETYDIDIEDPGQLSAEGNNTYVILLTTRAAERMKENGLARELTLLTEGTGDEKYSGILFPYDVTRPWTPDEYGPVWIPKKGASIQLTEANYPLYERAIRVYEGNEFTRRNGRFYLNGKEVTSYTFKMDYYWMMGDNRHASQDSRFWGFVPENRIVGKPSFIWFSSGKGIRWNRLFKSVQ